MLDLKRVVCTSGESRATAGQRSVAAATGSSICLLQKTTHRGSQLRCSNSENVPLLAAVRSRAAKEGVVRFHIPGHKGGKGAPAELLSIMSEDVLRHDLTEVSGLDILSTPRGVIAEAQQLAAQAFGADHTWFLVNGTSCGIHAAVLATTPPGKYLVLARNCHLSSFSAMVLAGCEPIWLQPEYSSLHGVAHGITPQTLEEALRKAAAEGRQVGAVLVVSPTYFGAVSDIKRLADVCHSYDVPLLVDEAHGGHFGHHPDLPPSALSCGADASIQSTHKVLGSLTQSSMLHIKGSRINPERVSRILQTLQSSSPSYLLMSSLDAARAQVQAGGCFGEAIQAAKYVRDALAQMKGVRQVSADCAGCSIVSYDPLRISLNVEGLGLSGYEADSILEEQHGIASELATNKLVVQAMGPGTSMEDGEKLVKAVRELSESFCEASHGVKGTNISELDIEQTASLTPLIKLSPREAFFSETERVPFQAAVGRVASELLCPYPPGVPVVFPGEVITPAVLKILADAVQQGGVVTGAADKSLSQLLVCK